MLSGPGSHGVAALCHRGSRLTRMQRGGHMQNTEMKGVEEKFDDENSGSAEVSEVKEECGYRSAINLCFLMFSCLIFESSVERGIPSFAAAPSGPATFPLLSAKAASIISFS
jgi:hypothetical protein